MSGARSQVPFVFAMCGAALIVVMLLPSFSPAIAQEKKCDVPASKEQKKSKPNLKFQEGAPCGDGLGKCKNDKCEVQGGGMPPMLPMLPMPMPPMDMPMMPMDPCSQAGSADVFNVRKDSGAVQVGTTSTSTPNPNP